jgi:D-glycero-D-manno-heptose 1,7-bisphosphate phosphatase
MLFLDRDGTLMEDVGYPNDPAQVRLIPGAPHAVRKLVELGFVPAVVSNQSGLGRGLITQEQADAVHNRFVERFETASGVRLRCYYCPHVPEDDCTCRKPRPGLLLQAAEELGMTGKPGMIIGDKESDVMAGRAAGYPGFLFDHPPPADDQECHGLFSGPWTVDEDANRRGNWAEALEWAIAHLHIWEGRTGDV